MIQLLEIPDGSSILCDGCKAPASSAVKDADSVSRTPGDYSDANLFLCGECRTITAELLAGKAVTA